MRSARSSIPHASDHIHVCMFRAAIARPQLAADRPISFAVG